jgi:UPF0755 protein
VQRFFPLIAAFLVLLMTAGAVWVISDSPGVVDEAPPAEVTPPPTPEPELVPFAVDEGAGVEDIARDLEDAGVIESAIQFRVLVSLMGYDRILQAGEYELAPDTPALQVIYRMRRGILSPFFVTVVEGWRLEEIADAVAEQGVIDRDDFLDEAVAGNFDDFEFLARLGSETPLEGYLYPATYYYRRTDTAESLIRQMLEQMDKRFTEELRTAALDNGLTMHGALTLASIVEREARVAEERPIMAQVFLTRLRRGIPLEADPTVQYALAEDETSVERYGYWKRTLTQDDLEVDSPYNTYRNTGLPLTPIAAPRLASIQAVAEPADTNYLYFVAKPDGSHAFAETFDEHQRNVEMYSD